MALGRVALRHVDTEDFPLVDVCDGARIRFVTTENFGDFGCSEVFQIVLRRADFPRALLLRLVLGLFQHFGEMDAAEYRLLFGEFRQRGFQFLLRSEQRVGVRRRGTAITSPEPAVARDVATERV